MSNTRHFGAEREAYPYTPLLSRPTVPKAVNIGVFAFQAVPKPSQNALGRPKSYGSVLRVCPDAAGKCRVQSGELRVVTFFTLIYLDLA